MLKMMRNIYGILNNGKLNMMNNIDCVFLYNKQLVGTYLQKFN